MANSVDPDQTAPLDLDRAVCQKMLENFCIEPRCEKTSLRGFRPGPTQNGLYDHTRWLEA